MPLRSAAKLNSRSCLGLPNSTAEIRHLGSEFQNGDYYRTVPE